MFSNHPTSNKARPNLSFIMKTLKFKRENIDQLSESSLNMFHILHQLLLVISDLNAGVVNIQRVISNQYQHNFQDFEVFL
jgi:hypothetical protein